MDYQKMYGDLIAFRKQQPARGYVERHHIIMRSMGGSNDESNLVALTGREHWVAHLLLHKIHCNSQTAYACHMMAMRCEERGIAYIKNSRMYESIRIECAKYIALNNSHAQRGKGNSQYGTRWICNLELHENRKISKDEDIPHGWILGRNKWNVSTLSMDEWKLKISIEKNLRIDELANNILNSKLSVKEFCLNNSLCYRSVCRRIRNSKHHKFLRSYSRG